MLAAAPAACHLVDVEAAHRRLEVAERAGKPSDKTLTQAQPSPPDSRCVRPQTIPDQAEKR